MKIKSLRSEKKSNISNFMLCNLYCFVQNYENMLTLGKSIHYIHLYMLIYKYTILDRWNLFEKEC